ncbi:hypothetical protein ONZ45_g4377 [Pleurotus djamor]|nr:hypothetical protein ONZ45_g4377 [Pleurotus djamor]
MLKWLSLQDSLDENTRLILPTDQDLPPSNDFAGSIVDQQDLRDKWTSIVRAKEGKMVNVNARVELSVSVTFNGSLWFNIPESLRPPSWTIKDERHASTVAPSSYNGSTRNISA